MSFIFKFKSNNGTYTLFDGAYSFVIETSKYTVIDCAQLTSDDLLVLAQHVFVGEIITLKLIDFYAYVQLRLLTAETSITVKDEGTAIGNISKLNFVGDGVTASLDVGDLTGKTATITIPGGGGGQTFVSLSFPHLPDIETSNELDSYALMYYINEEVDLVSDVNITLANDGEDIDIPVEVVFSQKALMPEGFTVRVTIKVFNTVLEGIHFYDGSDFIARDPVSVPMSTKTTWMFQMRDGNLNLISVTTLGDIESIDAYGYVTNSPFVRFDTEQLLNSADQEIARKNINATSRLAEIQSIIVAASDETTALTVGTAKVTFRMPYDFALTEVRCSLTTAQTGGSIFTVDINKNGTSILSPKLTIENTDNTSVTAVTQHSLSSAVLEDDAEITVDIDQIGNGTATGLKITLIGTLIEIEV